MNYFIKIVQGNKIHIIYNEDILYKCNSDIFMKLVLFINNLKFKNKESSQFKLGTRWILSTNLIT